LLLPDPMDASQGLLLKRWIPIDGGQKMDVVIEDSDLTSEAQANKLGRRQ
jgi:hypothetical protein